jgi:hypothetical protein
MSRVGAARAASAERRDDPAEARRQCKSQPDVDPPHLDEPRDSPWRRCQRMYGHGEKHRNVYREVW